MEPTTLPPAPEDKIASRNGRDGLSAVTQV